ncbi:MAG TPA: hypothetical protein VF177_08225 [Anaerolineae bacterium]
MNTFYPSIRWTAWFNWFVVTLVGLIAGLAVFIIVGSLLGEAGEEAPPVIFGIVLGTIFGTAFGIAHWLFLRRYLPGTEGWVPATIIAFALAGGVIFGLLNPENAEPSILLRISHAIITGIALGFAQWLILRAKLAHLAHLWILFSLGGWVTGELTGIAMENLQAEPPLPLLATFLIAALLPGIGMIWILRQRA